MLLWCIVRYNTSPPPRLQGRGFAFEPISGGFHGSAGHCQVNRLRNEWGLMMLTFRASSHLLDTRLLLPAPKRFGPSPPIADSTEAMTPGPEVTVDDGVR